MGSISVLFTLTLLPIPIRSWIASVWTSHTSELARATSVRSDSVASDDLDRMLDALKANLGALDDLNLQLHYDPTNKDLRCKVRGVFIVPATIWHAAHPVFIYSRSMEGCQVRQSTLIGSTRETGSSYLRCTEVGM
jgi:hypothetical protein